MSGKESRLPLTAHHLFAGESGEEDGVMAETLEASVRHAHIPREHFTLTDTFFEYSGDQGFEMWLGESQVEHQKFTRPASPRSGMKRRR